MLKCMVVAILALLCLAPPVQAADPGLANVVTVAVEANWPPMEYVDKDGDIVGYSVDYVNAVAKEAGFTVRYVSVPWDGIFDGLVAGDYDMVASSVSITAERQAIMDFSIPYYDVRQAVLVPTEEKIRRISELKGKRLGVQVATTGHFAANGITGVEVVSYPEIGQAIRALEKGEIDGVVADEPIATSFILEHSSQERVMKVAMILPTDEPEYYGFAVRKGNLRLREMVDRGILKVQEKGIDSDLRRKWIGF